MALFINITSTENFQVKAVYILYKGEFPETLETFSIFESSIVLVDEEGRRFSISVDKYIVTIFSHEGEELLSLMGAYLPPAGGGGDSILIHLYNYGSGDEELFVKVIVESAQTAEVTVNITEY